MTQREAGVREQAYGELMVAGMPKRFAAALAKSLDNRDSLKEVGEQLGAAAAFALRRGIVLGGGSPSVTMTFLHDCLKSGLDSAKVEARELGMSRTISWRPSESDAENKSLASFFLLAAGEFADDTHFTSGPLELSGWRKPPSRLAGYFKSRGIRYASSADLAGFLRSIPSEKNSVVENKKFIEEVLSDLPPLIFPDDARRYAMMLENDSGAAVRTKFPLRFAMIPQYSSADYEHTVICLVPESARAGKRLQNTVYTGMVAENHFPGALAYCEVVTYPIEGVGIQKELQSDHDPRETRGLHLENWPDLLREAMHADFAASGIRYSLIPKPSYVLSSGVIPGLRNDHGVISRIQRAYGTQDHPPAGYRTWAEAKPQIILNHEFMEYWGIKENYWVRELKTG